jgi:Glycosyl-transferase for dystroglycan
MALAGYSFYLLESIFLCHVWGLQHKNITVTSQRKTETSMNMQFFSTSHVRELAAKYDSDKFNVLHYQERRSKGYAIEMKAIKKPKT